MPEIDFQKIDNGSHVLLDTNILIDATKKPDDFKGFFDALLKKEVCSVVDQTTRLEFLRGARNKKELEVQEKYLDSLLGENRIDLENHQETFKKMHLYAKYIAIITNNAQAKQISLGDGYIAAIMAMKPQIILATQNHGDFLPPLFTEIETGMLRTKDGKIKTIGLYQFNKNVFETLCVELGLDLSLLKK